MRIAPVFGGINLEDIAAPACFEVEERLKELLDIPVFHDDQHGTAVVALAALENALKIVDKQMADLKVVIAGVGAAGVAIAKILHATPACRNIVGVDRKGAIYAGRDDLNVAKQWFAETHQPRAAQRLARTRCCPAPTCSSACSGPGLITADDLRKMAHRPDRVRHGQPRSRDPPEEADGPRRGHRHRPQRLPEPDQQRAGASPASSAARSTPAPRRSPRT